MKNIVLSLIIFLLSQELFAQYTGRFVYDSPASSQWDFYALRIKTCNDKGVLYIHKVSGVSSFILIKTDSLFNMQWAQEILNLPSTAFIQDIGEIPSGGYYVFASDNNNTSSGTEGEYLITFNNSGTLQWSKRYDVFYSGTYAGSCIKFFPTGEFLMIISGYGYGGYIVIDLSGNVLQGEAIIADASSSKNPGFDAAIVNDSLFVMIFKTMSDNYFVSMSKAGNLQWAKRYSVPDPAVYHQPRAIIKCSDGNLLASGIYSDSINAAGFLLKIDLSGNILWRKLYHSAMFTGLGFDGIAEKTNGNILLKDIYNSVIVEADSNANVLTAKIVDGNNIEMDLSSPKIVFACNRYDVSVGTFVPGLYSNGDNLDNKCALITYNGFFASGPPYNPTITNPITRIVIPDSTTDGDVLAYPPAYVYTLADACTGVGIEENSAFVKIDFHPNPANEKITIKLDNVSPGDELSIQVVDLSGKAVRSLIASTNQQQFMVPLQGLENGVYFLKVCRSGRVIGIEKLVIAN